jgi:hypothetical protein
MDDKPDKTFARTARKRTRTENGVTAAIISAHSPNASKSSRKSWRIMSKSLLLRTLVPIRPRGLVRGGVAGSAQGEPSIAIESSRRVCHAPI